MNRKIAKQWCQELRSGKYKQGTGCLCEVKGKTAKYCCLGVLCHILNEPYKKDENYKSYGTEFDLNPNVVKKCNMKSSTGYLKSLNESLASMNDNEKSFKEIANVIEAHVNEL